MPRWRGLSRPSLPQTILLLFGVTLLSRAFSFGVAGLDWDESLYIVIAQRWLHGGVPYVSVWDQHPMGLPAILAVANLIIGDGLLAARLACLLAVTATAVMLTRFLTRNRTDSLAGILAALFYVLYMARPDGLAANTEMFNNLVVTAASLLLWQEMLRPAVARRTAVVFAAALLLGMGLQIKYVVFPEAVLLFGYFLICTWHSGAGFTRTACLAAVALIGGLLPTAAATAYFWWAGAWQPYVDANLRANMAYVEAPFVFDTVPYLLRLGLLPLIGLLPWPIILLLRLRGDVRDRGYSRFAAWCFLWLLAAALDVALPLKFWKHYFNALIPPLCLIAGVSVMLLSSEAGRTAVRRRCAFATVAVLPIALLLVKHVADSRAIVRVNVPAAVAEHIRLGGSNGHDVYVFNYDPLVYAFAHAVPPTRYVLSIELSEFRGSSGARSGGEIDRILASSPRWIVVAQPSPYAFTPGIWGELDKTLKDYRLAAAYRENDYVQRSIDVRLYEKADQPEG